jgi:hypothetical protein
MNLGALMLGALAAILLLPVARLEHDERKEWSFESLDRWHASRHTGDSCR